jgi:hypothetical protein
MCIKKPKFSKLKMVRFTRHWWLTPKILDTYKASQGKNLAGPPSQPIVGHSCAHLLSQAMPGG